MSRSPSRSPRLVYEKHKALHRHESGIAALAFNPSGAYLASAGLDGRLLLWSYKTSSLDPPYTVAGTVGFVSLVWVTECSLLAGMADGLLMFIKFDKVSLFITTTLATSILNFIGIDMGGGLQAT